MSTSRKDPPERLSLSYLANTEKCLLLAHVSRYADSSGELAVIGNGFHEAAAALATASQFAGGTVPMERAEAILESVLANPDRPAPLTTEAARIIRETFLAWAPYFSFPEEADEVLIEWGSRVELGGFTHSARLDLVELYQDKALAVVTDYKAGPGLPDSETVEEHLQIPAYAVHLFATFPWLQVVEGQEHYVRWGSSRRPDEPLRFTREDLPRLEAHLVMLGERVRRAYETGSHDPTPGSWCAYCPAKMICPLPETSRWASTIETPEEAQEEMAALLVEREQSAERKKALRAYIEANGLDRLVVGDQALTFTEPQERFDRKKAMAAAQEQGVDLGDFVKKGQKAGFDFRKVKVDEDG